jgi:hypothetical protein
MMKKDFRPDDATKGNPTEPQPPRPAPHVRPARVFRTLVLTALAALRTSPRIRFLPITRTMVRSRV